MSDGAHAHKLLGEGMHFASIAAVVNKNVITFPVVKQLLQMPSLRAIDLQGNCCSHTLLPLLASSPCVSELTELHLGQKCLHGMQSLPGVKDALCGLLGKTTKLRRLTLPPSVFYYEYSSGVKRALQGGLLSFSVRSTWNGVTLRDADLSIHLSMLYMVCFARLRELEIGILDMNLRADKRFPKLKLDLPNLETFTVRHITSFMYEARRTQVKGLVEQVLANAPKLTTIRLPSAVLKKSLRDQVRDARNVHGQPIGLVPA